MYLLSSEWYKDTFAYIFKLIEHLYESVVCLLQEVRFLHDGAPDPVDEADHIVMLYVDTFSPQASELDFLAFLGFTL